MNRQDLAYAITEISDDLLLEAEHMEKQGSTTGFRRVIVAVAVAASLAVTVGAAAVGITWNMEKKDQAPWETSLTYFADEGADGFYYKLEYTMPLKQVRLREENKQKLLGILQEQWKQQYQPDYMLMISSKSNSEFLYDSRTMDHYLEQCMEICDSQEEFQPSYTALDQIEELLGIKLDIPEKLRKALEREAKFPNFGGLQVQLHTGLTNAQAREQWEQGVVEPSSIVISYTLLHYCSNGEIYGSFTIPLTQKVADEGLQCEWYSYEKEGAIWHEEQTLDGHQMHLFGNNPQKGYEGYAQAVYAEDGIGYRIGVRCFRWDMSGYYPNSGYESAEEMLLSLLENGE